MWRIPGYFVNSIAILSLYRRLIKSHLLNVVAEREAEAFAAVEAAACADECVRMHAEDVYSRRVKYGHSVVLC